MKNLSRCNFNTLGVITTGPVPPKIVLTSQDCISIGKDYLLAFSFGENVFTEIAAPSAICNYIVKWKTSSKCYIRFYDAIYDSNYTNCQYLADVDNNYCRYIGNGASFEAAFKKLIVITSKPVKCKLTISPINKSFFDKSFLDIISKKGHNRCKIRKELSQEKQEILSYSKRHARLRHLPLLEGELPSSVDVANCLSYYFDINTIITITTNCNNLAAAPYSIKCLEYSNAIAICNFNIEIKPCAGEDAEVTISAIETLSGDSYRILKDSDGKEMIKKYRGKTLTGFFVCPIGCPDIGLHIYTPYGFGEDSRDNCYTKLAKFHNFEITYQRI